MNFLAMSQNTAKVCGIFPNLRQTIEKQNLGQPGWLSSLPPPSAQGLILETQDRVPRRAPCMEPASPSACVSAPLSLCLSGINK